MSVSVFASLAVLDLSAEEVTHELNAVANPQNGKTQHQYPRIRVRRGSRIDGLGATGKDNANDAIGLKLLGGRGEVIDFRVDLALPNPARDHLCKLGTEVQDGDGLRHV